MAQAIQGETLMEPDTWTWPDAYDLLPEPDTDTNDTPDDHWDGSDDCPFCEGIGCHECDYTGGYE